MICELIFKAAYASILVPAMLGKPHSPFVMFVSLDKGRFTGSHHIILSSYHCIVFVFPKDHT